MNNKSLILSFPTDDIVPFELINHFMRGYFDGDGSFFVTPPRQRAITGQCGFSIIGTESFLDDYALILKKEARTILRVRLLALIIKGIKLSDG